MNASSSRREREQQDHRAHILHKVERLFAERGSLRVTMRQIVHAAEVALGTICRPVGGERQLHEEMLDSKMQEFVSLLSDQMTSATRLRQQVERSVAIKLALFYRNLDFIRVHFAESQGARLNGQQATAQNFKRKYDPVSETLVGLSEQGINEGVFVPAHRRMLASALDGVTSALAFAWVERLPAATPSAEIGLANRLCLKGVLLHV